VNFEKAERTSIMAKSMASMATSVVVTTRVPNRSSSEIGPSGVSISHQEIQLKAYHKWEAMGKPAGKDLEIWLRAQNELINAK
jgi:hypothetical protein